MPWNLTWLLTVLRRAPAPLDDNLSIHALGGGSHSSRGRELSFQRRRSYKERVPELLLLASESIEDGGCTHACLMRLARS